MDSVLGRDDELSLVRGFVAGASGGTAALVLEGEAGIGKTTLWRAGVEAARERSLRILSARPAAAERDIAYAALGDLLEGVLDEVLAGLPEPRRRALEIALLLAAPKGRAPDAHAVALALLSGLRSLSSAGAPLVAVDDVQWLDGSSAAALEFALRRLHDQPIRLLLARRLGSRDRRRSVCCPPTASSGTRSGHSAWGRRIGFCASGSAARSRGRRCCACRSCRAATRSSPSSWRGPRSRGRHTRGR